MSFSHRRCKISLAAKFADPFLQRSSVSDPTWVRPTPAHPRRINYPASISALHPPAMIAQALFLEILQKWIDFDTEGTPEALDERNPYSLTRRSHLEVSWALERGPRPQKWGRRHGEAFKLM